MNRLPDKLLLNGAWISEEDIVNLNPSGASAKDPLIGKTLNFLQEWFDDQGKILLKTSGSTGQPKQIHVDKQKMVYSAAMTNTFFNIDENHKLLLCLSPEFIAGKMMIVRAMLAGAELITTSVDSNPIRTLKQAIDFSAMVPLQLASILNETPEKLNLIKKLIIGGSAFPPYLEQQIQNVQTDCWHTYGMTETLSHVALRKMNRGDRSDYFVPLKGIDISADERGCLMITMPYLSDQPIVSNDVVAIEQQGFKVLGRYDEVIITAGYKIHPGIVEDKLSPFIKQKFFIAPEISVKAGQQVILFIEDQLTMYDLFMLWDKLEKCLKPQEIPRRIVQCDQFHYLPSGKLDKLKTIESYA